MTTPTNQRWLSRMVAVLLSVVASAQQAAPQSPQPIYQRQAIARVLIGGSPRNRDGSYNMSGVSTICGEIPKEASLTGEAVFVVEFPGEGSGPITTMTFGSNQLVAGVTKATVFRLSVGVVNPQGADRLSTCSTPIPSSQRTPASRRSPPSRVWPP